MKYSKSAIGLLTAQYRSVLKKCWMINVGLFALGMALSTPAESATLNVMTTGSMSTDGVATGGAATVMWNGEKKIAEVDLQAADVIAALGNNAVAVAEKDLAGNIIHTTYAKKTDLESYATTASLASYATTASIDSLKNGTTQFNTLNVKGTLLEGTDSLFTIGKNTKVNGTLSVGNAVLSSNGTTVTAQNFKSDNLYIGDATTAMDGVDSTVTNGNSTKLITSGAVYNAIEAAKTDAGAYTPASALSQAGEIFADVDTVSEALNAAGAQITTNKSNISTNTTAITKLNGNVNTTGSVLNSIRENANSATHGSTTIGAAIEANATKASQNTAAINVLNGSELEAGSVAKSIADAFAAKTSTSVASGDAKLVTSGAVYTAIDDAKTAAATDAQTKVNALATGAVATNTQDIATLKGTGDGSVSKKIADEAKNATYSVVGSTTTTIADAIAANTSKIGTGSFNVANKNLTNGGTDAPASTVEALNNLDATLGVIHGLSTARVNKGNLATGTTVEEHLLALDSAIDDRALYNSSHYANTGSTKIGLSQAMSNMDTNVYNAIHGNGNAIAFGDAASKIYVGKVNYTGTTPDELRKGLEIDTSENGNVSLKSSATTGLSLDTAGNNVTLGTGTGTDFHGVKLSDAGKTVTIAGLTNDVTVTNGAITATSAAVDSMTLNNKAASDIDTGAAVITESTASATTLASTKTVYENIKGINAALDTYATKAEVHGSNDVQNVKIGEAAAKVQVGSVNGSDILNGVEIDTAAASKKVDLRVTGTGAGDSTDVKVANGTVNIGHYNGSNFDGIAYSATDGSVLMGTTSNYVKALGGNLTATGDITATGKVKGATVEATNLKVGDSTAVTSVDDGTSVVTSAATNTTLASAKTVYTAMTNAASSAQDYTPAAALSAEGKIFNGISKVNAALDAAGTQIEANKSDISANTTKLAGLTLADGVTAAATAQDAINSAKTAAMNDAQTKINTLADGAVATNTANIATLNGAKGDAGSVLTMIDTNAKDATYSGTTTIAQAIDAKANTADLKGAAYVDLADPLTEANPDDDAIAHWAGTNAAKIANVGVTFDVFAKKLNNVQHDLMDSGNTDTSIAHALGGTTTEDTLPVMIKKLAADAPYDNTISGLTATKVKTAIDENAANVATLNGAKGDAGSVLTMIDANADSAVHGSTTIGAAINANTAKFGNLGDQTVEEAIAAAAQGASDTYVTKDYLANGDATAKKVEIGSGAKNIALGKVFDDSNPTNTAADITVDTVNNSIVAEVRNSSMKTQKVELNNNGVTFTTAQDTIPAGSGTSASVTIADGNVTADGDVTAAKLVLGTTEATSIDNVGAAVTETSKDTKVLASTETVYNSVKALADGAVATNTANIAENADEIAAIKGADFTAAKATADADGNVISSTYAKLGQNANFDTVTASSLKFANGREIKNIVSTWTGEGSETSAASSKGVTWYVGKQIGTLDVASGDAATVENAIAKAKADAATDAQNKVDALANGAVADNTADIATLNGDADTAGSVKNSIKTLADSATHGDTTIGAAIDANSDAIATKYNFNKIVTGANEGAPTANTEVYSKAATNEAISGSIVKASPGTWQYMKSVLNNADLKDKAISAGALAQFVGEVGYNMKQDQLGWDINVAPDNDDSFSKKLTSALYDSLDETTERTVVSALNVAGDAIETLNGDKTVPGSVDYKVYNNAKDGIYDDTGETPVTIGDAIAANKAAIDSKTVTIGSYDAGHGITAETATVADGSAAGTATMLTLQGAKDIFEAKQAWLDGFTGIRSDIAPAAAFEAVFAENKNVWEDKDASESSHPTTIAQAFKNIDSNLGTIHGLAASLGDNYNGNLASGSSVSDHLTALDTSIGNRAQYIESHYANTGSSAIDNATAIANMDTAIFNAISDIQSDYVTKDYFNNGADATEKKISMGSGANDITIGHASEGAADNGSTLSVDNANGKIAANIYDSSTRGKTDVEITKAGLKVASTANNGGTETTTNVTIADGSVTADETVSAKELAASDDVVVGIDGTAPYSKIVKGGATFAGANGTVTIADGAVTADTINGTTVNAGTLAMTAGGSATAIDNTGAVMSSAPADGKTLASTLTVYNNVHDATTVAAAANGNYVAGSVKNAVAKIDQNMGNINWYKDTNYANPTSTPTSLARAIANLDEAAYNADQANAQEIAKRKVTLGTFDAGHGIMAQKATVEDGTTSAEMLTIAGATTIFDAKQQWLDKALGIQSSLYGPTEVTAAALTGTTYLSDAASFTDAFRKLDTALGGVADGYVTKDYFNGKDGAAVKMGIESNNIQIGAQNFNGSGEPTGLISGIEIAKTDTDRTISIGSNNGANFNGIKVTKNGEIVTVKGKNKDVVIEDGEVTAEKATVKTLAFTDGAADPTITEATSVDNAGTVLTAAPADGKTLASTLTVWNNIQDATTVAAAPFHNYAAGSVKDALVSIDAAIGERDFSSTNYAKTDNATSAVAKAITNLDAALYDVASDYVKQSYFDGGNATEKKISMGSGANTIEIGNTSVLNKAGILIDNDDASITLGEANNKVVIDDGDLEATGDITAIGDVEGANLKADNSLFIGATEATSIDNVGAAVTETSKDTKVLASTETVYNSMEAAKTAATTYTSANGMQDAGKIYNGITTVNGALDATGEQIHKIINVSTGAIDNRVAGAHGTALIFNEADGGGAKFEHTDGTWSGVAVNDGGANGMAAQIYAVNNSTLKGTRINVTTNGIYYTNGRTSGSDYTAADEIATLGTAENGVYTPGAGASATATAATINEAIMALDGEFGNYVTVDYFNNGADATEKKISMGSGAKDITIGNAADKFEINTEDHQIVASVAGTDKNTKVEINDGNIKLGTDVDNQGFAGINMTSDSSVITFNGVNKDVVVEDGDVTADGTVWAKTSLKIGAAGAEATDIDNTGAAVEALPADGKTLASTKTVFNSVKEMAENADYTPDTTAVVTSGASTLNGAILALDGAVDTNAQEIAKRKVTLGTFDAGHGIMAQKATVEDGTTSAEMLTIAGATTIFNAKQQWLDKALGIQSSLYGPTEVTAAALTGTTYLSDAASFTDAFRKLDTALGGVVDGYVSKAYFNGGDANKFISMGGAADKIHIGAQNFDIDGNPTGLISGIEIAKTDTDRTISIGSNNGPDFNGVKLTDNGKVITFIGDEHNIVIDDGSLTADETVWAKTSLKIGAAGAEATDIDNTGAAVEALPADGKTLASTKTVFNSVKEMAENADYTPDADAEVTATETTINGAILALDKEAVANAAEIAKRKVTLGTFDAGHGIMAQKATVEDGTTSAEMLTIAGATTIFDAKQLWMDKTFGIDSTVANPYETAFNGAHYLTNDNTTTMTGAIMELDEAISQVAGDYVTKEYFHEGDKSVDTADPDYKRIMMGDKANKVTIGETNYNNQSGKTTLVSGMEIDNTAGSVVIGRQSVDDQDVATLVTGMNINGASGQIDIVSVDGTNSSNGITMDKDIIKIGTTSSDNKFEGVTIKDGVMTNVDKANAANKATFASSGMTVDKYDEGTNTSYTATVNGDKLSVTDGTSTSSVKADEVSVTDGATTASVKAGEMRVAAGDNQYTSTKVDGVKVVNGAESSELTATQMMIADQSGNSSTVTKSGMEIADASGNNNNITALGMTLTDSGNNTNSITASGITLTGDNGTTTVTADAVTSSKFAFSDTNYATAIDEGTDFSVESSVADAHTLASTATVKNSVAGMVDSIRKEIHGDPNNPKVPVTIGDYADTTVIGKANYNGETEEWTVYAGMEVDAKGRAVSISALKNDESGAAIELDAEGQTIDLMTAQDEDKMTGISIDNGVDDQQGVTIYAIDDDAETSTGIDIDNTDQKITLQSSNDDEETETGIVVDNASHNIALTSSDDDNKDATGLSITNDAAKHTIELAYNKDNGSEQIADGLVIDADTHQIAMNSARSDASGDYVSGLDMDMAGNVFNLGASHEDKSGNITSYAMSMEADAGKTTFADQDGNGVTLDRGDLTATNSATVGDDTSDNFAKIEQVKEDGENVSGIRATFATEDGDVVIEEGSVTADNHMTVGDDESDEYIKLAINDEGNAVAKFKSDEGSVEIAEGEVTADNKVTVGGEEGNDNSVVLDRDGNIVATNSALIGSEDEAGALTGVKLDKDGNVVASNTVLAGTIDEEDNLRGVVMDAEGDLIASNSALIGTADDEGLISGVAMNAEGMLEATKSVTVGDDDSKDFIDFAQQDDGSFKATFASSDGDVEIAKGKINAANEISVGDDKVVLDSDGNISAEKDLTVKGLGTFGDTKKVVIDEGNITADGDVVVKGDITAEDGTITGDKVVANSSFELAGVEVKAIDTGVEPVEESGEVLATTASIYRNAENGDYNAAEGAYTTVEAKTINEAFAAIDGVIGNFPDGLEYENHNLDNHDIDNPVKPKTIVEAFNNIDSTLGTIHGLADKLDQKGEYNGNLAEGTTVEQHLAAIDKSIGDRRNYTNENVITSGESVAASLDALDTAVGDVSQLKGRNFVDADNLSDAVVQIDDKLDNLDSRMERTEHDLKDVHHELRRGMASMAAMSALVPNSRSTGKTSLSLGTGAYSGHGAVAVGGFHYLTDNLMLNAGAAWSNSRDAVYRVGVTYSF